MTVYNLFQEQVQKNANSIAIEFGNTSLTYEQLSAGVNQMTSYLKNCGVKKGDIVGISLHRSYEMIISLLGIIKVGGIYLPLDPAFPPSRLQYMLEDSKCPYLITENSIAQLFEYYKGRVIKASEYGKYDIDDSEDYIDEENIAYILYTSGSTGNPKGVQIRHKSLVNFLLSMKETPGINSEDSLLAVTTLSFDISGLEIYLPLISGAKLVLISKEETIDGKLLLEKLKNITVMQATPATWKLLLDSGWNEKLKLKALCGGESLRRDLADRILERVDELWNMYGPTETTIWSSCYKVEKGNGLIHLGGPIANTQFYIVDKNNQFCAPGVAGELLIGGAGLSVGYLNRRDLTVDKFIPNPFDKEKKSKLYKTGDLVKLNSNNKIEFLGRIDNQIKIRGFRIELGEIETRLLQHANIKEAAVVVNENQTGEKKLVAYIIPKNKNGLDTNSLMNFLKEKVPEYMIPSFFVEIDNFPLTPNGKIDRKALPEPDGNIIIKDQTNNVPQYGFEKEVSLIWKEILEIGHIRNSDNFFAIGGNSLLAIRMIYKLNDKFNIDLPLSIIFDTPTVSKLSDEIDKVKQFA